MDVRGLVGGVACRAARSKIDLLRRFWDWEGRWWGRPSVSVSLNFHQILLNIYPLDVGENYLGIVAYICGNMSCKFIEIVQPFG